MRCQLKDSFLTCSLPLNSLKYILLFYTPRFTCLLAQLIIFLLYSQVGHRSLEFTIIYITTNDYLCRYCYTQTPHLLKTVPNCRFILDSTIILNSHVFIKLCDYHFRTTQQILCSCKCNTDFFFQVSKSRIIFKQPKQKELKHHIKCKLRCRVRS